MTTATRLRVLSPVAEWEAPRMALVSRVGELRGKTIGLLDNGKPNNDIFQARLAEMLQNLYPEVTIYAPGRAQRIQQTPQQFAEACRDDFRAHRCDAVIVSMSD